MLRTLVVAEAGVNHDGDLAKAMKLVDLAHQAQADIVKFQTFDAKTLTTASTKLADYQKLGLAAGATQQSMLEQLQLTLSEFSTLADYCASVGIEFLSTAFDIESLDYLLGLGMRRIKIPSGEITNMPLLKFAASAERPILLSTGMATIEEISAALAVIRDQPRSVPEIAVLQCTSMYPTPFAAVNLRAMKAMETRFDVNVGLSDHSLGISVPIGAVALGATVVEKHLTVDHRSSGPDHSTSLEPEQFAQMVKAIREIESALGSATKEPTSSEMEMRDVARKSVVAARFIAEGQVLAEEDLTTKRPGTGLSPMLWNSIVGTKAKRDFVKDEMLEL